MVGIECRFEGFFPLHSINYLGAIFEAYVAFWHNGSQLVHKQGGVWMWLWRFGLALSHPVEHWQVNMFNELYTNDVGGAMTSQVWGQC